MSEQEIDPKYVKCVDCNEFQYINTISKTKCRDIKCGGTSFVVFDNNSKDKQVISLITWRMSPTKNDDLLLKIEEVKKKIVSQEDEFVKEHGLTPMQKYIVDESILAEKDFDNKVHRLKLVIVRMKKQLRVDVLPLEYEKYIVKALGMENDETKDETKSSFYLECIALKNRRYRGLFQKLLIRIEDEVRSDLKNNGYSMLFYTNWVNATNGGKFETDAEMEKFLKEKFEIEGFTVIQESVNTNTNTPNGVIVKL